MKMCYSLGMQPFIGLMLDYQQYPMAKRSHIKSEGIKKIDTHTIYVFQFLEDLEVQPYLTTAYWTSMTRQGCNGKIVNCAEPKRQYQKLDWVLWQVFDKSETGACVAMQTIPREFKRDTAGNLGPIFTLCDSLNYLACEGNGSLSKYIGDNLATVIEFTHL